MSVSIFDPDFPDLPRGGSGPPRGCMGFSAPSPRAALVLSLARCAAGLRTSSRTALSFLTEPDKLIDRCAACTRPHTGHADCGWRLGPWPGVCFVQQQLQALLRSCLQRWRQEGQLHLLQLEQARSGRRFGRRAHICVHLPRVREGVANRPRSRASPSWTCRRKSQRKRRLPCRLQSNPRTLPLPSSRTRRNPTPGSNR
jgi:hypothetical protein